MKKTIIIIFVLIACIILSFTYAYNTFKKETADVINFNAEFENYYEKEIYGAELATIMNKIINNNNIFNVEKDNNGNYVEDESNSMKMDIYILDSDTTYSIERIYSLGTARFVENFNTEKFKCTKIEYHNKTGRIKYLYFEQVSQK